MNTRYSKKRADFEIRATALTERLHWLIDEMPYKGDICADSQKLCLLNALKKLEACVAGTVPADFIEGG
jgi:hypothetical protein